MVAQVLAPVNGGFGACVGGLFINERISGVRTRHALRFVVSRPSSRSLALMENVTKQFAYAIKIHEHIYAKHMLRSCRLDEVADFFIHDHSFIKVRVQNTVRKNRDLHVFTKTIYTRCNLSAQSMRKSLHLFGHLST